jgi:putative phosphoesterase
MPALARVAALYDVHGNLPALEAVLAEVEREGVDAIVSGGDVVAGPFPAECAELLRRGDALCLRGNADRQIIGSPETATARWCAERLPGDLRAWIAGWEETIALDVEGLGTVHFCHGSPRRDEEILTEATPDDLVAEIVADTDAAVVVCGHTHHQFDRRIGDKRVVNAGSVGLPYEGKRGAYWLLLGRDVEHRRTEYDVDGAMEEFAAAGYPDVAAVFGPSLVEPVPKTEAVAIFESRRGS